MEISPSPSRNFRTFTILWAAQSISLLGSSLTLFAINIWLAQELYPGPEQKEQLALALTATGLVEALSIVLLSPMAGAWVDRADRRTTMLGTDFACFCASLVLGGLLLAEKLVLWNLLLVSAWLFAARSVHRLAFQASFVMLVPEGKLGRANAMFQATTWLAGVVAPGLAAAILSLPGWAEQGAIGGVLGRELADLSSGVPLVVFADALTFLAAAVTLPFLKIPNPERPGSTSRVSIRAEAKEGLAWLSRNKPMVWLMGVFTVSNLGPPIEIIYVLILKTSLAGDWGRLGFTFESALALLYSIGYLGGGASGLLMVLTGGLKKKRVYGVLVPLVVLGAMNAVFGFSPWYILCLAAAFGIGAMNPLMNTHENVIWQTRTPPELQGRVFAARQVVSQFTWPISTAAWGWISAAFNPALFMGAWGVLATLFFTSQFFNPIIRKVDEDVSASRSKEG